MLHCRRSDAGYLDPGAVGARRHVADTKDVVEHARARAHFDAHAAQACLGPALEVRVEAAQNRRRALDEHDADLVRTDVLEVAPHGRTRELTQGAGGLARSLALADPFTLPLSRILRLPAGARRLGEDDPAPRGEVRDEAGGRRQRLRDGRAHSHRHA